MAFEGFEERDKDRFGIEKLEGSVEQIVFCNDDNGYTVCDMALEDDIVTVCGIMPMLCEGDRLCDRLCNKPPLS